MVTYPLSLPGAPSALSLRLRRVVGQSESPFTGQQSQYEWPGAWWEGEATIPPRPGADAAAWRGFFTGLRGKAGTFLLGDPAAATPRGSAAGTPVVDGADQTGSTLLTTGWEPDEAGVLLSGDYIQLGTGSDSRLYMVVADADADASGQAALSIEPPLRTSPADGAAVITHAPKGLFRLAVNDPGWDVRPGPFYSFSFAFREAL